MIRGCQSPASPRNFLLFPRETSPTKTNTFHEHNTNTDPANVCDSERDTLRLSAFNAALIKNTLATGTRSMQ